MQSVTVITPAVADPVSSADAKLWAKIDTSDDDTLIASLVSAATQAAEDYTRRAFINRTLKLTLDLPVCTSINNLPDGVYDLPVSALTDSLPETIQLPFRPVSAISSVVTYALDNSSSTFSSSNYRLDTASGRLTLNYGCIWPANLRNIGACEITYVAGYGASGTAVPTPVKTAILMHFQRMYDGRIVCDMPERCEQLLKKYKLYG